MDWSFDIGLKNRAVLNYFLETLSLEQLNKIPDGFNNNIFWNIAHTIATQQILIYRLSGLTPNISDKLIDTYKKGTKPEQKIGSNEVEEIKALLFSTVEKTQEDYNSGLFKNYQEYTVTTKNTLTNVEEAIEFNNFHEGLHLGYILALKRAL